MATYISNRDKIGRISLRAALETRRRAQKGRAEPLCIYDVVETLGTEVWFVGGSSFAGMYARGMNRLFVPSLRPSGRKAFTCAHEFGHHFFDHGNRIEELDFDRVDQTVPEEITANSFAAHLLMPKPAVKRAFDRRELDLQDFDEYAVYNIACQLGVGYGTLLKHLRWSLQLIDHHQFQELLSYTPKSIRTSILGEDDSRHLALVDPSWECVSIDLEVGDKAILPSGTNPVGESAISIGECKFGSIIEAVRPGLTQVMSHDENWASFVRVSRRNFEGRGAYRHLEDPDYDTSA